jgi:hypothetical protein
MSRIAQARRRITVTRYAIGIASAAALAAFAVIARTSHPGTHSSSTASTSATTAATSDDSTFYGSDDSESFSNIGPSGSATPQVQSGAS